MLKTVFDPEIPVNVYDLGLIYGIELKDDGVCVQTFLTFFTPALYLECLTIPSDVNLTCNASQLLTT